MSNYMIIDRDTYNSDPMIADRYFEDELYTNKHDRDESDGEGPDYIYLQEF